MHSHSFPSSTLQIRQHPFTINNSTVARKHSHNKKHINQQKSRARTNTSPSQNLFYAVYNSNEDANCARVFMPNCTQMETFSPIVLRLCDREPPADFDDDLCKNMYKNPTLDSMFYQFVLHIWIGGEQDKNNFVGTQSKDLHYLGDVLS